MTVNTFNFPFPGSINYTLCTNNPSLLRTSTTLTVLLTTNQHHNTTIHDNGRWNCPSPVLLLPMSAASSLLCLLRISCYLFQETHEEMTKLCQILPCCLAFSSLFPGWCVSSTFDRLVNWYPVFSHCITHNDMLSSKVWTYFLTSFFSPPTPPSASQIWNEVMPNHVSK